MMGQMSPEQVATSHDDDTWRREFSLPESGAYLNHAAVSPLPLRVVAAVERALGEAVPGADALWSQRRAECDRVRAQAATLLGARLAREVAFVPNTSTGLSFLAEGLSWRPGDNVVSAASEFPSNVYPWLGLADRGVELRRTVEVDGRIALESLARSIDARTRVVALSWVQYATGFRIDLGAVAELCRARDALLVVDAIQGLGALQLSVAEARIDACVAGSHKWLMGGEGVGVLYVSQRALERLRPVVRGWLSVEEPFGPVADPPRYLEGAERFECGTANVSGIYGLGAAIDWLLEVGPARVEQRVLELAGRIEAGLAQLGFESCYERTARSASGIVAAAHPSAPARPLCKQLAARGFQVAERRGLLRLSPHFYNSEEEIDRCLENVAELV